MYIDEILVIKSSDHEFYDLLCYGWLHDGSFNLVGPQELKFVFIFQACRMSLWRNMTILVDYC
jgi:hypothetical protein